MSWKEYQNLTTDFFESLGMRSEADMQLTGARGVHDIDVLVKFVLFGVEIIWIVECKLWKRSIPKEKVLTLQQIAQDVGADRAFLLSESGFQAGAVRVANNSNVTLTSLGDLKLNSQDDWYVIYLKSISKQLHLLNEKLLKYYEVLKSGKSKHIDDLTFTDTLANLFTFRTELFKAISNVFPIHLYKKTVYNYKDFLDECETAFASTTIFLDRNEQYYQDCIEQLISETNSFTLQVNKLLNLGETVLFKEENFDIKERLYLEIVSLMRQIDLIYTTHFKGKTDSCSERITSVMKILVIHMYKFITETNTPYDDWINKETTIRNHFSQLESTIHRLAN